MGYVKGAVILGTPSRSLPINVMRLALIASLLVTFACGGTSPPPPVAVSITPPTASLTVGSTEQFMAAVSNTPNGAVTWSVNSTVGGSATLGTISTTGLYTAPDPVPNPPSVTVTATSQEDTTKSASATVSLSYATPSITSISPNSAVIQSAGTKLTVDGDGFSEASRVTLGKSALSATFVSQKQLTATIPASSEETAGTLAVTVANPSPGGGISNIENFAVDNPAPTVSSVSPDVVATGSPATEIIVAGQGFVATSRILLNGAAASTTFVSSSQLTASVPASVLSSGTSVSVAVENGTPGGGTSPAVDIQLVSVASLALLATPASPGAPAGPWIAFVVAQDDTGKPISGLAVAMTASQGTLGTGQGSTDANGAFSTTVTPPAGISSSQAVGLVANIGGQSVVTSLAFAGIPNANVRPGNSAAFLRARLGGIAAPRGKALSDSTITFSTEPVAIGISEAAPGSSSPFAGPNSCYTFAALSSTETDQCAALFQAQKISLQPSNPFQAGCSAATVADTAIGVGECLGTALTVVSCLTAATGIGTVVSAGTTDAICAATIDLTESTLAPDCAEFIINAVTQQFSPSAATAEELVELSVEPSDNPINYVVTYCDISNSTTASSLGAAIGPVAGNVNGSQGYTNGPALSIELNAPTGIALDASGNVYFDDDGNNVIRKLNVVTKQVITFAGTGVAGYTGDGGPAMSATLNHPTQLAFDADYNLYIADAGNNVVREISAADGTITTVAGTGQPAFNGDGQEATQAALSFPDSLAFDAAGNLYIADADNNRIREVSSGIISTVAGNGAGGYNGDNISATAAELNEPTRVALDSDGNLYIADYLNNRVRLVDRATGIITTLAGDGNAGYQGDKGPASKAELNGPISVTLDDSGNVYISELGNYVIRAINMKPNPATVLGALIQPGDIDTVVGGGTQSDLVNGAALSVSLSYPTGLLTDATANLYFADADNNVILKVTGGN